jgi:uncharacterized protein YndB with AHSA1/START domain
LTTTCPPAHDETREEIIMTNPGTHAPSTTANALVIERTFDAPVELVWKAWTDPAMAKQWWGPSAFSCPIAEMDVRVGGKSFMAMQSPDFNDGEPIYSTGVYREVVPLERLVTTDCFADADGNVVPATHYGMGAEMPLEMLVTVTFEDLGGKTKMTLRHEGLPAGETSEGANVGWNESLDKLAALLAPA